MDNRPEAIAQRKLQEMANNSPQANQADQLQSMAENHSNQQQQPIQKKEIEKQEGNGSEDDTNQPKLNSKASNNSDREAYQLMIKTPRSNEDPAQLVQKSNKELKSSSAVPVIQKAPNLKHQMAEGEWSKLKKQWKKTQYNKAQAKFNRLKAGAAFDDPKLVFNSSDLSFKTEYTYQQITELHPNLKNELKDLIPQSIYTANPEMQWPDLMTLAFGTAEYKQMLAQNEQMLSEGGDALQHDFDFDSFDNDKHDELNEDLSKIDGTLDDEGNADSALNILLSGDKKGFLLGETHADVDSKEFLMKNMASLKSKGVTTIYMEHFKTDYQSLLNQYLSAGNQEPMPPGLDAFIAAMDAKHNLTNKDYNVRSIVVAAKNVGMRIVGIDDIQAKGGQGNAAEQRVKKMNFLANKTITDDDRGDNGKFVALTGAAHNKEHTGKDKSVPGLSQTLDVPALIIKDGRLQIDKNITEEKE